MNPPNKADLTITPTTITVTRGTKLCHLASTRGYEPLLINPTIARNWTTTSGTGSAVPGSATVFTSSISGTTNLVLAQLTNRPWYVCVRNQTSPTEVDYTLYSCALTSVTQRDLTSTGLSNSTAYWGSVNTSSENNVIQFDELVFTIDSTETLDFFPVPETSECFLENTASDDEQVLITTQNMLAYVLHMREWLTTNGNTWYVTNRQADNLQSDIVSGDEGGCLFGAQFSLDQTSGELTFDDTIEYEVPVVYTVAVDNYWLFSKKINLNELP